MPIAATIAEYGDSVFITAPVTVFEPEQAEIETFAFAADLKQAAPNPKILWLRGQYVEADAPNRNGDQWTAGELAIKALTPVLMPVTVMHDLRSAVGTIADARLLTPEKDQVPRARIDATIALWSHRFPEVAEETRTNAAQGTLMASMECLSPTYNCSTCGLMIHRTANWQQEWREHVAGHDTAMANADRSSARILNHVTFTGVGLIFGTRGARGAMPDAHLEVEELAAMHREAHESTAKPKRQRSKNTVEIEDSKYEALVASKSDAESKVTELTAAAAETARKIETLEAEKVKAEEERDTAKAEAETAKEAGRVAAMKDERLSALGTGFRAKLDKLETTAKNVADQAAKLTDEEWAARLTELEETLSVKRDAKLDEKPTTTDTTDTTAGLLFDRKDTQRSGLVGAEPAEVTASDGTPPSTATRQSVMGGLIRNKPKATAKA